MRPSRRFCMPRVVFVRVPVGLPAFVTRASWKCFSLGGCIRRLWLFFVNSTGSTGTFFFFFAHSNFTTATRSRERRRATSLYIPAGDVWFPARCPAVCETPCGYMHVDHTQNAPGSCVGPEALIHDVQARCALNPQPTAVHVPGCIRRL